MFVKRAKLDRLNWRDGFRFLKLFELSKLKLIKLCKRTLNCPFKDLKAI